MPGCLSSSEAVAVFVGGVFQPRELQLSGTAGLENPAHRNSEIRMFFAEHLLEEGTSPAGLPGRSESLTATASSRNSRTSHPQITRIPQIFGRQKKAE
jgi:hypothetical protein